MRTIAAAVTVIAMGVVLTAPAGGATFKVNCDNRDLQDRIDAVAPGSTILVKGTCERVTIDKKLTLDGNPTATIDAGGAGRPVTISGTPRVRLIDLRLRGGHISLLAPSGGGILHLGGTLTLRRVVVAGNTVDGESARGGGIYSQGTLELFDSVVRDNRTRIETGSSSANARGGGIMVVDGALTLVDSQVKGNRAIAIGTGPATLAVGVGGGVELEDATRLSIRGSSVSGNRAVASLEGGTVYAEGGGLHGYVERGTIRGSVLDGNQVRATSSGGATVDANGGGGYLETLEGLDILRSRVTDSLVLATTGGTAIGKGAGFAFGPGSFSIRSSRIASNEIDATGGSGSSTARGAGLIGTSTAELKLEKSTVNGNRARVSGVGSAATGGGIELAFASLTLRSSTVSRNVASSAEGQALGGGIIFVSGGPQVITNSTIAGNRASGGTARGGGINTSTDLTVTHATVARNEAKLGGGLYVEGGTTTLRGTILALNTAPSGPDCSQNVSSAGRNLIGKTTGCALPVVASDKRNVAAKLGGLGANGGPTQTIPLKAGSPALNAIPAGECSVGRDQRGVKRPQGPRCDIGAYERRT